MAQRTKTIEYVFPMVTVNTNSGTARDFTTFTLNIPENTSRTFRSVILEMSFEDNTATGGTIGNITAVLQGIQIDAVARSDATVTQTLTASGENQSYTFMRDVTSYFQTNFTGTSHTLGARLTVTGSGGNHPVINSTAKLIITYEYSDTAQTTRIKTVKIPIDGNNGSLTTTLANVGAASQIPALDTFLPEASKVYRDIFFETFSHTGQTTGTATYNLNISYNGGTTTTSTTHQGGFTSDYVVHRIDKLMTGGTPTLITSSAQNLQASVSSANAPHPCFCGVLVVTYEYNHSTTTTVINSVELPAVDEAGWSGGTAIGDAGEFRRTIIIQEPGTINLVQSGVLMSCIDAGAISMDIRIGAQTSRVYAHPATVRCGSVFFMRRFDSGATGSSAGYTYDRGFNIFEITFFTTSATAGNIGSNVSGTIYLNYTSDLAAEGDGVHNHTTKWINRPYSASSLVQKIAYTAATTPIIPETDYYTTGVAYQIIMYTINGISTAGFVFQAELLAGESFGAGWYDIYATFFSNDTENAQIWSWARARDEFKRHPEDPDTDRLDIEGVRTYRFDNPTTNITHQAVQNVTYHGFLYNISSDIQNSSGGLVTVNLHRSDNGELVHQTSRTGDGNVQIDWHDNTIEMYIVAVDVDQSTAIHSSLFFAGGQSPLLDFAGGGGGPTYYAYAG